MATILLSIPLVLLSVAGLALGALVGRRPLAGSCGGVACQRHCAGCKGASEEPKP